MNFRIPFQTTRLNLEFLSSFQWCIEVGGCAGCMGGHSGDRGRGMKCGYRNTVLGRDSFNKDLGKEGRVTQSEAGRKTTEVLILSN